MSCAWWRVSWAALKASPEFPQKEAVVGMLRKKVNDICLALGCDKVQMSLLLLITSMLD